LTVLLTVIFEVHACRNQKTEVERIVLTVFFLTGKF
jgi:hypothetical protein